ncbi:MAG: ribonuclease III [Phycisphaerales bacterium]|jgi:ribonuclease-3
MDQNDIATVEEILGHRFSDRGIIEQALLHASHAEHRLASNERLEFLGDAVLAIVVCDHIFRAYPDLLEGELTKIKSNVVSRRLCAEIAIRLDLPGRLRLGKGMAGQEPIPQSLAAAAFEAVIGALYLDAGMERARAFVLAHVEPAIERAARLGHQRNFKSVLQQALQRNGGDAPTYVVLDEKGPDHAKCFEVCVESGSRRFAACWGSTKKEAEQQAALQALLELGIAEQDGEDEVRLVPDGDRGE